MAYGYNPYGWQNYAPYQNYQQPGQQPVQQQMHNGGFVNVQNEQEARNYPVAPQTSVTFHNENEPYIYTKTVGSSLEAPKFEIFKLTKVDENVTEKQTTEYVSKEDFLSLKNDFENFKCKANERKKKNE